MSDAQKLKDCIAEYLKSNKALNDKLKKIEAESRQNRIDKEAQSSRPN